MPEKSEVLKQKLKKKAYFDFKETYDFCYRWFKDEGFLLQEDKYKEKLSQFGKEIEITWSAMKNVSDYFRDFIEVKWLILGMTDEEVLKQGKKIKTNKGEIEITIKAELIRDYEKRWEDKPFYKFLRGVYDRYILWSTIEEYEDRLRDKTNEFIDDLKAWLELEIK